MKQLKESILDKDFDINIDFANPEFINEKVFEEYVNEAKGVNTEMCANMLFQDLRSSVEQYKQNLQKAGVSVNELMKWGKRYDSAKKPIWLAEELEDYDEVNIKERISIVNFLHKIDEFMDKNIRNWSKTTLYTKSGYPIMVHSGRVGDFTVEMRLDETPENIELVKQLVKQKDENFTVEDWGANKIHTYFIGFIPTKKSY